MLLLSESLKGSSICSSSVVPWVESLSSGIIIFSFGAFTNVAAIFQDSAAVLLDIGNLHSRLGLAGGGPVVVPSRVGRPKYRSYTMDKREDLYGKQVTEARRSILQVSNVSNSLGEIEDCDRFSSFLRYGFFDELGLTEDSLEQHPIVVACPPSSSHRHLRHLMHALFEHFPVPSVALVDRPVLAVGSLGLSSGTVLDTGHCVTTASCVYEGHVMGNTSVAGKPLSDSNGHPDGVSANAGQAVTETLSRMLQSGGATLSGQPIGDNANIGDKATVRPLGGSHLPQVPSCTTLSSGQTVCLEDESALTRCTEILFAPPSRRGLPGSESLQSLVRGRVELQADRELQRSLRQVVLCGGTAKCPGLASRLQEELGSGPDGYAVSSVADAVWLGGVRFAMESDLPKWSISRADYDEVGDNAALKRRS
eukprot:GHVS01036293.1.p1 GENE.GHVS01036293.1~~GHVS01036293.1.p1  ORF type:complete len:423 (-),score=59.44 GHVS01036293.1:205-1473(-)